MENESSNEDLKNVETPATTNSWRRQNSDAEVSEDKEMSEVPRNVRAMPNVVHKDLTFLER